MFQDVASDPTALPGVVITVQSYGDCLNLHPQIHAIASRGVWSCDGSFEPIPALDALQLMLLFRHHVLQNLLACGRIGQATLDILDRFHHPGFSAYEGEGVAAGDSAARERLASYLVHAPFSLARLHYQRDAGIVTYEARASSRSNPPVPAPQRFSPLDALAALTVISLKKGFSSSGIAAIIVTRPADNGASDNNALPASLPWRPLCPSLIRTTSAATADRPGHG